jgi:hypothetical protein
MTPRQRVLILIRELDAQRADLIGLLKKSNAEIRTDFDVEVVLPLKSITARAENFKKIMWEDKHHE